MREKIEAIRTDHSTTIVGVLFCLPIKPLRKGYRWTITQKEKKSFPNNGPHELYPLLMASDTPATIPTMLKMIKVVGGIRRVVHLKRYSSPNSASSADLEVTVKLVSTPASTFKRPWKTANKWAETPPITQNCSFLHQSSMLTPLHLNSRTPVTMMEMNRAKNHTLAKFVSWRKEYLIFKQRETSEVHDHESKY